jgi:hypothetical protein
MTRGEFLSSNRTLAVERVCRDDHAFQREKLERFRTGGGFIGLAIHRRLTKHRATGALGPASRNSRNFLSDLGLFRERFLRADAHLGSATLPPYVSPIAN